MWLSDGLWSSSVPDLTSKRLFLTRLILKAFCTVEAKDMSRFWRSVFFLNSHFRNFHYHTVVTTLLLSRLMGTAELFSWSSCRFQSVTKITIINQLACLSALLFLRSAQVCVCVSVRQTERERWNQNRFQWRKNADEPALWCTVLIRRANCKCCWFDEIQKLGDPSEDRDESKRKKKTRLCASPQ